MRINELGSPFGIALCRLGSSIACSLTEAKPRNVLAEVINIVRACVRSIKRLLDAGVSKKLFSNILLFARDFPDILKM